LGPTFYDVVCGVAYCAPAVEKNYSRPLGRRISSNRLTHTKSLPDKFRFRMTVSDIDLKGVDMEYLVVCALQNLPSQDFDWVNSLIERRLSGYVSELAEEKADDIEEATSNDRPMPSCQLLVEEAEGI
jgi:hypothetical protein